MQCVLGNVFSFLADLINFNWDIVGILIASFWPYYISTLGSACSETLIPPYKTTIQLWQSRFGISRATVLCWFSFCHTCGAAPSCCNSFIGFVVIGLCISAAIVQRPLFLSFFWPLWGIPLICLRGIKRFYFFFFFVCLPGVARWCFVGWVGSFALVINFIWVNFPTFWRNLGDVFPTFDAFYILDLHNWGIFWACTFLSTKEAFGDSKCKLILVSPQLQIGGKGWIIIILLSLLGVMNWGWGVTRCLYCKSRNKGSRRFRL